MSTASTAPPQPTRQPVRLGIIGGGFMGRRHAEIAAGVIDATVVGIADPYTKELAADLGVPHYLDHRDLLRSSEVDGVIIANPNAAHVAAALDCIDAGRPCLLEKPVALSRAEVQPLLEVVQAGGSAVLVGHHRRHHPSVQAAREAIASGRLGNLVAVHGMWLSRKADQYFDVEWRRQPGAGVLMINAVHDLDILRHLCGDIVAVQAQLSSAIRELPVADTASVSFEMANGALGSYLCSDAAVSPWSWDLATQDEPVFPFNPTSSCYFIAGTHSALTLPQMTRHYYPGAADWNQPLSSTHEVTDTGDSFTRQLVHFVAVVRGEAEPLITVVDAASTIALLDAVRESAASGKRTVVMGVNG